MKPPSPFLTQLVTAVLQELGREWERAPQLFYWAEQLSAVQGKIGGTGITVLMLEASDGATIEAKALHGQQNWSFMVSFELADPESTDRLRGLIVAALEKHRCWLSQLLNA